MKTLISKKEQTEIFQAYKINLQGKNWGTWNVENMPNPGIGFQMLQYVNDNDRICDVIKFDQPVLLEGLKRTHQSFHFKFKPNHDTTCFPIGDDVDDRECQCCGHRKPYSDFPTSRRCAECDNELIEQSIGLIQIVRDNCADFERELNFSVFRSPKNNTFIDLKRLACNIASPVRSKILEILKNQRPDIFEHYTKYFENKYN